jgi:CelD/BcsL family acetyltransferase involved in cellulose biosynthesis
VDPGTFSVLHDTVWFSCSLDVAGARVRSGLIKKERKKGRKEEKRKKEIGRVRATRG